MRYQARPGGSHASALFHSFHAGLGARTGAVLRSCTGQLSRGGTQAALLIGFAALGADAPALAASPEMKPIVLAEASLPRPKPGTAGTSSGPDSSNPASSAPVASAPATAARPLSAPEAIARMLDGSHAIPEAKPAGGTPVAVGAIRPGTQTLSYAPVKPPEARSERPAPRVGRAAPNSTGSTSELEKALVAIAKNRPSEAMAIRNRMQPSLDRRIVDWKLIVDGDPIVSTAFIADFAREAPHWPNASIMRSRAEIAFYRSRPSTAQVLREFKGSPPTTITGKLLYARALQDARHGGEAARLIRELWREDTLSASLEKSILSDFSKSLRHEDHRHRTEMFLYRERIGDAERNAKHLRSDERAYVAARAAVIRRKKDAAKLMGSVPRSMRDDAGYVFAKIQMLRRANKDRDAIALMLKAPRKASEIVDGDEWWVERRLQSRNALDLGDARAAYAIAAGHGATSPGKYAEAEFHAGWFALRFLKDAKRAMPHFHNIEKVATTPITSSRAFYWQGRAAEAMGQKDAAQRHYREAAKYSTAYYGQLAMAELGLRQPAVPTPARATSSERSAFDGNELVRAIRRMAKAGRLNDTTLLFRELGLTMETQGKLGLAIALAEKYGRHQVALMVGKLAAQDNNDLAALAFPVAAIPKKAKIAKGVEKPVVYAIARQESAFNPGAVSHAGARGLLQLMPGTAKITARKAGLKYSKSRLTRDAAYNATLGAFHLGELVDDFNGSYIMTFAGYNAGARRVREWVERFGDPRSSRVDAIDWVERIPFTETRNYVQRITENLQVYRARLDGHRQTIREDLSRGHPG